MINNQTLLEQLSPDPKDHFQISKHQIQFNNPSFISNYNLFIRCYNTDCNRIDQKNLILVPQTKVLNSFNLIILNQKAKALLFFLFLIPFVNLMILVYLLIVVYFYFKAMEIYKQNQLLVKNPLENMKYDPQICNKFNKKFHFMTLNFKNLKPQFNFKENLQLTQSQGKLGLKSRWMIYNQEFASYYYDLPKYRIKLFLVLLTGVSLTLAEFIFIFYLI